MSKLALALIIGVCAAGLALIIWGLEEKCPAAEVAGEKLIEEAVEATLG